MRNHETNHTAASAALLCGAGLLLFNWPLLSISADSSGRTLFSYLFIGWLALIAGLFFCARQVGRTAPPNLRG